MSIEEKTAKYILDNLEKIASTDRLAFISGAIAGVMLLHPPRQESFDKIADLWPYLLRHPDADMVRMACAHCLGDEVQEFINRKTLL